jgi:hypothetical protein
VWRGQGQGRVQGWGERVWAKGGMPRTIFEFVHAWPFVRQTGPHTTALATKPVFASGWHLQAVQGLCLAGAKGPLPTSTPCPFPPAPDPQDKLGQDMFLVGPAGPHRRRLALAYAELTGREVEFVTVWPGGLPLPTPPRPSLQPQQLLRSRNSKNCWTEMNSAPVPWQPNVACVSCGAPWALRCPGTPPMLTSSSAARLSREAVLCTQTRYGQAPSPTHPSAHPTITHVLMCARKALPVRFPHACPPAPFALSGVCPTWQAPVRAAVHGRLLVIDGIEKAERNVLPLINNLLENRQVCVCVCVCVGSGGEASHVQACSQVGSHVVTTVSVGGQPCSARAKCHPVTPQASPPHSHAERPCSVAVLLSTPPPK